jgi:hypothetical protein
MNKQASPQASGLAEEKYTKQSTRDKYASIYGGYKARFLAETQSPDGIYFPWKDFALWAVSIVEAGNFSSSYKGTIRAALLHSIKEQSDGEDALAALRMIEIWEITSIPKKQKEDSEIEGEQRRTRNNRRMIPKDDWSTIINHFNMNPSKWGIRAQNMISASIGCGARPIEWISAQLIDESTIRIYNAKVKNINAWNKVAPGAFYEGQYSVPKTRIEMEKAMEERIRSSGLDPVKDIAMIMEIRRNAKDFDQKVFRDVTFEPSFLLPIRMTIRYVEQFFQEKYGQDWRNTVPSDELEKVYKAEFYAKVRIAVWRACKFLFGEVKLYSPADARSTFAANRKARFGIEQTAIDMGHTSTKKTRDHYAPARKAWSKNVKQFEET